MAILTGLDNRHHRRPALAADPFIELGIGALTFGATQLGTGVDRVQSFISRVVGWCLSEVQVVAVEVDVVLVDPTHPGRAPRVDQVDHQYRDVVGQAALPEGLQPLALAIRAVITFHAVGAAQGHQHPFGLGVAEQGHICAQGLGERAAQWVRVMAKTGADGLGGGEELFTLLGKAAV